MSSPISRSYMLTRWVGSGEVNRKAQPEAMPKDVHGQVFTASVQAIAAAHGIEGIMEQRPLTAQALTQRYGPGRMAKRCCSCTARLLASRFNAPSHPLPSRAVNRN